MLPLPQRLAFSPMEFSFATGLGLSTIYRHLASGEIKSHRLGRRVLIPRDELERLCRGDSREATVDTVQNTDEH